MKACGGAKGNASLKQGVQVSTATQRVSTTTRHHHTEKLSGDILPTSILTKASQEGGEGRGGESEGEGEGPTVAQMHNLELEIAQPPRASMHHLKLVKNPYVK